MQRPIQMSKALTAKITFLLTDWVFGSIFGVSEGKLLEEIAHGKLTIHRE